MHLKRNSMPRIWPLERKGSTYIVRPLENLNSGLPLTLVLRDILQVAKTRKEVKNILKSGQLKVNGKVVREDKYTLTLFDNLTLDNKNYKIGLKNKKFDIVEDKNPGEKISKVVGKKMLDKGRLQINLNDGRNYLIKEKVNTGDSVIINFKDNKITEVLPFKEGSKIIFISGKHIGEHGKVEKVDKKEVKIKVEKEEINAKLENFMVVK